MNYKEIAEQAKKELDEEKAKAAKEQIKGKLKSLDTAKQVVKNIERELEDLMDKLQQDK